MYKAPPRQFQPGQDFSAPGNLARFIRRIHFPFLVRYFCKSMPPLLAEAIYLSIFLSIYTYTYAYIYIYTYIYHQLVSRHGSHYIVMLLRKSYGQESLEHPQRFSTELYRTVKVFWETFPRRVDSHGALELAELAALEASQTRLRTQVLNRSYHIFCQKSA